MGTRAALIRDNHAVGDDPSVDAQQIAELFGLPLEYTIRAVLHQCGFPPQQTVGPFEDARWSRSEVLKWAMTPAWPPCAPYR